MTELKTHDFCGVTIYDCPECGFDHEHLPTLQAHMWHRHEVPRRQAAENAAAAKLAAERPQATLYTGDGALVERIERSEPPPEISEDTAADPPEETHD